MRPGGQMVPGRFISRWIGEAQDWMRQGQVQGRILVVSALSPGDRVLLEAEHRGEAASAMEVLDLSAEGRGGLPRNPWSWLTRMGQVLRGVRRSDALVLHDSLPRTSAFAAFARASAQILKKPVLSWDPSWARTPVTDPKPAPSRERPRRRVRRFAYLGLVTSAGGVAEILDASQELRNLPFRVDVHGPLVDGFTEGAFRESYRVHHRGPVDGADLSHVLEDVDALLLVPRVLEESFPRIVLEAFTAGRPVIASRCGVLPQLVEDGISGILVSPGDSGALAHALRQMIESPELLSRLQQGASRSVPRVAALLRADELARACADERQRQAAARLDPGWRRLSLRRPAVSTEVSQDASPNRLEPRPVSPPASA